MSFTIGSILENSSTNEKIGTLVNYIGTTDDIIIFRIVDNLHPVFSKLKSNPIIRKSGHINDPQYNDLRMELLKYYRTRNLSPKEKGLLDKLMIVAFPLGVPLYDSHNQTTTDTILEPSNIPNIGSKIYLNTSYNSSINHLDDTICYIVDKLDNGMWVASSTNDINQNNLHFLFWKDKARNTISGVSKYKIVSNDTTASNNPEYKAYQDLYAAQHSSIPTYINFNGYKIRLDPKSLDVLFPLDYQGYKYNPDMDNISKDEPKTMKSNPSIYILDDEMHDEDISIIKKDRNDNTTKEGVEEDNEIQMSGGGNSSKIKNEKPKHSSIEDLLYGNENENKDENKDESTNDIMPIIDDEEDDDIFLKQLKIKYDDKKQKQPPSPTPLQSDSPTPSNTEDELESEIDSDIFETEDDDDGEATISSDNEIEILDVVKKVERLIKPEEEKTYKDDLQKNELFNATLETIPHFLRTDERLQNVIKKKINIIIRLKNIISSSIENNNSNFNSNSNSGTSPLVKQYITGDFRNHLLIPLVVNSKKIYLEQKLNNSEDNYNITYQHLVSKFFKELEDIQYLIENKKRNTYIDQDTLINNILNTITPFRNLDKNAGFLIRLGQGIKSNDFNNFMLDTMTIRYCDQGITCQSFGGNKDKFDYSVSLGALQSFVSSSNDNLEDIDDNMDTLQSKSLLNVISNFKNYRKGEMLDIIGFVRLPLNLIDVKNNRLIHLNDIYKTAEIKTVKLDDTEINNVLHHPTKLIMYLLPENVKSKTAEDIEIMLNTIIPTASEIITYYRNIIKKLNSFEDLEILLQRFGFSLETLNISNLNILLQYYNEGTSHYKKRIDKLNSKYLEYLKNFKTKQKETKNGNGNGTGTGTGTGTGNENEITFITDDILDELEKLYDIKYPNRDLFKDSDRLRLDWVMNRCDNGAYLYYYLLNHYYQKTDLEGLLGKQIEALKLTEQQLDVLTKGRASDYKDKENTKNIMECNSRINEYKPRVVRYATEDLLKADNGKEITDSEGNIILDGDYAIVKSIVAGAGVSVYVRKELKTIGDDGKDKNVNMWIKQDKSVLLKLLDNEKRRICNPTIETLELKSKCGYVPENAECVPPSIAGMDKDIFKTLNEIKNYKDEIGYLQNAIKISKGLNKELKTTRQFITDKNIIRHKVDDFVAKETAALSTTNQAIIKPIIPCPHFTATKFLFNLRNSTPLQEYQVVYAIMRKFRNYDVEYDYTKLSEVDSDNWVECNICSQNLLCKHYLLGLNQIQEKGELDDEEIRRIYAVEDTDSFNCRACGYMLSNTEVKDIAEFLHTPGAEGKRNADREILENMVEELPADLDKYLEELDENGGEDKQRVLEIKFYIGLKQVSGVENELLREDDNEMVNFIKTFQFETRNRFITIIMRDRPNIDKRLLYETANIEYIKHMCCDIAVQFLITLQTSSKEYSIENRFCNKNYYGFPLDPDETKVAGIRLMGCLIKQIATDMTFKALNVDIHNLLLKRVKLQVSRDEYIVNKLLRAVADKGARAIDITGFENHYTNEWRTFRPILDGTGKLGWEPEKYLVMKDAISATTAISYNKMMSTASQDFDYLGMSVMNMINLYVEDKTRENKYTYASIGNTCCLEPIKSGFKYIDYFVKGDETIGASFEKLETILDASALLKNKVLPAWFLVKAPMFPLKSKISIPITFQVSQEEMRELFMVYISTGEHAGEHHNFDSFGRCIISGETINEIKKLHITGDAFNRLITHIHQKNRVYPLSATVKTVDEKDRMSYKILGLLKEIKNTELLTQSLNKLMDIWSNTKSSESNPKSLHHQTQPQPQPQPIKLESSKIWWLINSQIQIDIDAIASYLTGDTAKKANIKNTLNSLSEFKNLYEEELMTNSYETANYNKNKKREADIRNLFQFFSTAVAQVRNKKLQELKIDKIRPQYHFMYSFKDEIKLFERIYKILEPYCISSRLIYGMRNSSYISVENSSILLHYMFISAIYNIVFIDARNNLSKTVVPEIPISIQKKKGQSKKVDIKKGGSIVEEEVEEEGEGEGEGEEGVEVESGVEGVEEEGEGIEGEMLKGGNNEEEEENENVALMMMSGGSKSKPTKTSKPTKSQKVIFADEEEDDDTNEIIKEQDLQINKDIIKSEIYDEQKIIKNEKEDIIEPEEFDFNKSIDYKETSNTNIIIDFITRLIKELGNRNNLFNALTNSFIEKTITEDKEKQQRRNLGHIRKLKFTEGLEEQYKLIMIQLQFHQIEYKDLYVEINDALTTLNLDKHIENINYDIPDYAVSSDTIIGVDENINEIKDAREADYLNYVEPIEADYGDGNNDDEDNFDSYD